MLDNNIKFVVQSIEKAQLVNLNGILYQQFDNFFDKDTLEMLSFDKQTVSVSKFALQENRPRFAVNHNEKIHKHMTIMFRHRSIREVLENKFDVKLKGSSVDIWFDSPGYCLEPHTDFHNIQLSLQIYLGDPPNPGTSLYGEDGTIIKTFDYFKNNGYSLMNNEVGLHGVNGEILENNLRKSIYVRFYKI
jgi:hypothetical protein